VRSAPAGAAEPARAHVRRLSLAFGYVVVALVMFIVMVTTRSESSPRESSVARRVGDG
jgi:hypothetical protein